MTHIDVSEIQISARQESYRMRHFYLGVEHLFIALLEIRHGLLGNILADEGLSAEYVADLVRRKVGKGGKQQAWTSIPTTPRATVVLDIAHEIALAQGRQDSQERDLLLAILDEQDNLCVRILRALGLEIEKLRQHASTRPLDEAISQSFVAIVFAPSFGEELPKDQLFLLRKMFHGYAQLRVETRLMGGYSLAQVLVVTPIRFDGREDASVVVKLGDKDVILDEAQRYERFVKNTLPPLTARLEERPTAPDLFDIAGIKYTFITDGDGRPKTMRALLEAGTGEAVGQWLKTRLYPAFGKKWWRQARSYRFHVWQEYDHLLPPMLTLELIKPEDVPKSILVLRDPIRRTELQGLEFGSLVAVENFTVYKVDADKGVITLALAQRSVSTPAYQIEITGIDFSQDAYYRNEVVERIAGRVWRTRGEQMRLALRALSPDFDDAQAFLSLAGGRIPNPIAAYERLLDIAIDGTLCTVHGDLHLGNILVGADDLPLLIDFARTRDGHTLSDWAMLELSLLMEMLVPRMGESWEDIRLVAQHYAVFNQTGKIANDAPQDVDNALRAVRSIREIVRELLYAPERWAEYYVALVFTALRALSWESLALGGRRLLLYVASLALVEFASAFMPKGQNRSADATEFPPTMPDHTD